MIEAKSITSQPNVDVFCFNIFPILFTLSECCPEVKVYQVDEDNWDAHDKQSGIFTTYKLQPCKSKGQRLAKIANVGQTSHISYIFE